LVGISKPIVNVSPFENTLSKLSGSAAMNCTTFGEIPTVDAVRFALGTPTPTLLAALMKIVKDELDARSVIVNEELNGSVCVPPGTHVMK
jgi:hypothetical protein